MKRRQKSQNLRQGMKGALFEHDRLWRITGPNFVAGLCEYNDEITGYAPILKEIFKPHVHYGGNAYYILNQALNRGYTVESVDERPKNKLRIRVQVKKGRVQHKLA